MNIKEIWEKYKESGKSDKILDAALSDFQQLTGFSIDQTIDAVEAVSKGDLKALATSNKQISLFVKSASSVNEVFANLLDSDDIDGAATYIQKIMSRGSDKDRKLLVSAFDAFDSDKRISTETKQELANKLKDLKIWNSFNSFYQRMIHQVRSLNKVVDKKWIPEPSAGKTDFLFEWQRFFQAKDHGAPMSAKLWMAFKLIKIILTRFVAISAIVGVLGLAYVGYDKIKHFVDNVIGKAKDVTPHTDDAASTDDKTSTNNKEKVTDDTVSKDARDLIDLIDKKQKAGE